MKQKKLSTGSIIRAIHNGRPQEGEGGQSEDDVHIQFKFKHLILSLTNEKILITVRIMTPKSINIYCNSVIHAFFYFTNFSFIKDL